MSPSNPDSATEAGRRPGAAKTDLARIRDNQRRSRAKRKEYIQDLEKRLRLCELQGIEASSEIQVAARKVAEENRKLRALLRRHGVDDHSINVFLQSASISDPPPSSLTPSPALGDGVQNLETLLGPRRPSFMGGPSSISPSSPGSTSGGATTFVSGNDKAASGASRPLWDDIPAQGTQQGRSASNGASLQIRKPPLRQPYISMAGETNASQTEAALALQGLGGINMHSSQREPSSIGDHNAQTFAFDAVLPLQVPPNYGHSQHGREQSLSFSAQQYRGSSPSTGYAAVHEVLPSTDASHGSSVASGMSSSAAQRHTPNQMRHNNGDYQMDHLTFHDAIVDYATNTLGF